MRTGLAFLAGVIVTIIVLQLIGKSMVMAYQAGSETTPPKQ